MSLSSSPPSPSRKHGSTQQIPRRLAPIDHVRALYEGAVKSMDPDRPCNIAHKKDLIEAVRRVSPTNRDRSPKIVIKKNNAVGGRHGVVTDLEGNAGKSEITNLEDCINIHARRFNNLKSKCDKKQQEVDKLMDQLAGLDKEIESLQKMEKNNTPETIRIQELRKKINEVQGEIEGKLFVRKQLEFMLRRLRDNEVVMDSKVRNMEDALDAAKKEYEEVKTLLRDLEAKKRASVVELQRVQLEVSVARKQRMRQIAERRQQASNAKRMEEWRKSRENARKGGAGDDVRSGNSNDDDSKSSENDGESEVGTKKSHHSKVDLNREMTLEEAFTQIRQATGITTLEEMVEKFMGQKASKEALLSEKRQAEAQLKATKQLQQQVEEKFASMKASGIGGSELNREIYDRLDDEITAAKRELRKSVEANQRLEEVLVSVRLGAFGLLKRLEPFSHLIDPQEEMELPRTGNKALDALLKSELRLSKMIDLTIAAEKQSAQEEKVRLDRDITATRKNAVESWDPTQDQTIHENNIRVDTLKLRNEIERELRVGDEGKAQNDDSDDELLELRGSLKRQSARGIFDQSGASSVGSHLDEDTRSGNDDRNTDQKVKDEKKRGGGGEKKNSNSRRRGKTSTKAGTNSKTKMASSSREKQNGNTSSNRGRSGGKTSSSSSSAAAVKKTNVNRRSVTKPKKSRANKRKSNIGSSGRRADMQ